MQANVVWFLISPKEKCGPDGGRDESAPWRNAVSFGENKLLCVCARGRARACVLACVYVHACVRVCVRVRPAYMRACVRASPRACAGGVGVAAMT